MNLPKPILKLIESFERLPGIGPKTAQRLTFYLLHFPQEELQKFADALVDLKREIKLCEVCKNVTEFNICSICDDSARDQYTIAIVANALDVFALEKTGFKGVYHVLHGVIDPLNNIGPEEIFIADLKLRVQKLLDERGFDSLDNQRVVELIMATNSSMEGESTALYISKMLRDAGYGSDRLKISRIARGLPVGGDIEFADDITLSRAMEGRSSYTS
ncbi:recombination protein RecR [candidate division WWE3 bacterium RIFOXYC1_FULL_39_7]|uniref:Recombination protein RecR n=2 Tax=Katanobacteria TaxID=422282 RepID=A0A1F4X7F6_UNCKA|nr:MAG: recombination protein RecR [candidate division WWE3 bacterium RIFOXYC1_FULL_39_7]OGC77596.1 MAG: recombination protein RecR [candidate division WWE3 bacterium RIFOXYD1_FULL_39_9]